MKFVVWIKRDINNIIVDFSKYYNSKCRIIEYRLHAKWINKEAEYEWYRRVLEYKRIKELGIIEK
jgi:hypothetical protein